MSAPTGAVIFLHGTGDSGPGFEAWLESVDPAFVASLRAAGLQPVFPSAPTVPYSMAGGEPMPVWFDRTALAGDADEDAAGLAATAAIIAGHVKQLCDAGVPAGKIFLGGFSQGGSTALYSSLATEIATAATDFCGVFSLGSWVTTRSRMWPAISGWEQQRPGRRKPRIFLAHGGSDGMIDPAWGEATRDQVGEGFAVVAAAEMNPPS